MKIIVEDVFQHQEIAPPEKVLWLAVIGRAMLDVVFPTNELSIKHKLSLEGFFWNHEPVPYNLEYICSNLFDYPDAPAVIRKRLRDLVDAKDKDLLIRSKRIHGYY